MATTKESAGCASAFGGLFALAGLVLLGATFLGREGDEPAARWAMGGTGAAFVAFGLGLVALTRRAVRLEKERARLVAEFPSEPWRWRAEWQAGRIPASTEGGPAIFWIMAVVWNAMGIPAAFALWPMIANGQRWLVVAYLFPLLGLLLLYSAIQATLKARKFGRPVFRPTSVPGEIGGYLGGVIEVPAPLQLESDLRLSLASIRREVRGSGDSRSVREDVLWEAEERLARDRWRSGATAASIPVLFHIPAGCVPSEPKAGETGVQWRLRAQARVPGVDFTTAFEVPVFATGRISAPPPPGRGPLLEEYRDAEITVDALKSAGVEVGPSPGEFRFTNRHIRSGKVAAASMTVMGAALAAGLVVAGAPWLIVAAVLFFDLILLAVAYDLVCGNYRVEIQGGEVAVTHRGLLRSGTIRVPCDDIGSVSSERSMAAGATQYFRLKLVGKPGVEPDRPHPGEHFAARKLRYRLRRVMKELGISSPGHGGERTATILKEMTQTPRFEVKVAGNIPHFATAEKVAEMLLKRIRGSR